MKTGPKGIALIKEFESLALTSYQCPAGIWTISWGVTGPEIGPGMTITVAEAEEMFAAKLAPFEKGVNAMCPETTQCQFDAMVCLAYNIGVSAFRKSSVARLHNQGDYIGASRAFLLWNKATGADGVKQELRGLTRRRSAEATLYMTDDGKEEPQRTRAVDVEPEKPLAVSKTMIGSGVAAASTVSSYVSDIDWLKGQLTELTPYLPAIQTALVALGLLGIGIAMYARWQDKRKGHG